VVSLALTAATLCTGLGDGTAARNEAPTVRGFLLESASGERVSLEEEQAGRVLTALVFLDVDDAVAQALAPRLAAGERQYRGQGVRFLAIDGDEDDSPERMRAFAAASGFEFPFLRDPFGAAAERAGATRSGEVVLLDGDLRVVYRGAADDQFEDGAARAAPSNDYLVDAIESALAGETIDPAVTETAGAPFARRDAKAARAITFHRDVAPILWNHCAECHRPGQIGPMSFLDADEAAGWAPTIAEVVAEGRMPPWHASPRHGRFVNERRLTETEKKTLELWASGGAKLGDPAGAPPRPVFADAEWRIGEPDRVIELPEEQTIPAEGVQPYRYVAFDPRFDEDFWVQSVEVRPTARGATHHVIAYLLPPGMSSKDALRNPQTILSLSALGGYAPGSDPMRLPDGQGFRVVKGSTLLFELHYTPTGKAATDRTRIGFRRSRVPITEVVETGAAMNFSFRIPPRATDATFQASHRFRAPASITTFTPHMHRRGKAFRYELERQDGTRQVLLDVPRYDFNWQHTYVLSRPVAASAGDTLRVTAVYDNSKANPFNPNPDTWVSWGDQTFEEMLIGYFDFVGTRK